MKKFRSPLYLYLFVAYLFETGVELTGATEAESFKSFVPPIKPVHPMRKLPDNFNRSTVNLSRNNSRVANGCMVKACDACYQALIYINAKDGTYLCGGVIVSGTAILTAAHCCIGYSENPGDTAYTIQVGLHDIQYENVDPCVQKFYVDSSAAFRHLDYKDDKFGYDICRIIIPPIDLTTKTACAIKLAEESVLAHTASRVSGHGITGDFQEASNPLLVGLGTITYDWWCSFWFQDTYDSTSSMCWLGKCDSSACGGDSGGPITVLINGYRFLYGLVSYGLITCEGGIIIPFAGTKIPSYIDWIEEHVQDLYNPYPPDITWGTISCRNPLPCEPIVEDSAPNPMCC